MNSTPEQRKFLRDTAAAALAEAEKALVLLSNSYTEEKDGKFSACHPATGHASTSRQIQKLRRALERSKV